MQCRRFDATLALCGEALVDRFSHLWHNNALSSLGCIDIAFITIVAFFWDIADSIITFLYHKTK